MTAAQPDEISSPRRHSTRVDAILVAMLIAVLAAVLVGLRFVEGEEHDALQARLDGDATNVTEQLSGAIRVLAGTGEAMAGLLGSMGPERDSGDLNQGWFTSFAGSLVADGQASLLAFAPSVSGERLDEYQSRVRQEGKLDFTVFDLVGGQPEDAAGQEWYAPVQYIEPFNQNTLAVGYDLASDPVVKAAIVTARDSGDVSATTPRDLPSGSSSLLLAPVYDGPVPASVDDRKKQFVGVAIVGYRPQVLLDRLGHDGLLPSGLAVLLRDALAGSTAPPLAMTPDADAGVDAGDIDSHRDLTVTDGSPLYGLSFTPGATYVDSGPSSLSLIVIIVGLMMVVALAFVYGLLRRRSNLDLLGLTDRLTSVLRASPDAFIGLDRDGRIVEWSLHAQQLFGWSRPEATGRWLATLIGVGDDEPGRSRRTAGEPETSDEATGVTELAAALIAPLGSRERRRIDCAARTRDGVRMTVEIQVSDRRQPERWSLSCFVRDVSERKRAEQQLVRMRQMETVDNMARELTHDFNNLLTIVMGSLDLVGAEPSLSHVGRRRLGTAMTAAMRGADLTRSLMYVSRINHLDPVEIDVGRLLGEMEPLVRQALGPSHELQLDVPDKPLAVYLDPGGLSNALLNLVINARDAMPGEGRLTILAARQPGDEMTASGWVVIEVSDTGIGMAPEAAEHAFEPFFTTKPLGKGTGLGLATVHGFVVRSGGDVTIESAVGAGTTVRMRLAAAPSGSSFPLSPGAAVAPGAAGRILLVDDEDAVRETAVAWLTQLGYEVEEASSAESAIERLRQGDYRLLVTDVVMAGPMDGLELARRARQLDRTLSVLIVTAFAGASAAAAAEEAGVRVILKPYTRDELAGAVRGAITSPGDPGEAVRPVGAAVTS